MMKNQRLAKYDRSRYEISVEAQVTLFNTAENKWSCIFNKQVNKFCRPYWLFGILFMGLPKAKYVVYHIHVPVHTCFRSKKE